MSNWREQFEDESALSATTALFGQYYHYLALALLVGFAFWNRVRNWSNYVVDGEILFRGNDPWYHYRSTQYVVTHFPETMPFDPWTNFPTGTANAQFGTIYDQFVATIALVVGLGSPDAELVKLVALFAPAVVAVFVAVPTYLIGRRIGGRFAGIVAVAIFAFASDRLLSLSVAGFFDHHVAEALTQALAVLGVMVAIRVAERDKPVWELLADAEWGVLRRSLGWGILAGFGIGLYLSVWPPGVLLLGILGVFFVVHLSFEYLRGRSPEHAAFVGAVALGSAGVFHLSTIRTIDISATSRSLLQPGLAFAVAAGCVVMAWLAREWDARDLSPYGYPVAVVGLIVASAGLMAVLLPDLFGFFQNQVLRVVGFQTSPTAGTVGEAQPGSLGQVYRAYDLAAITALGGALILLARQYVDDDVRGEYLLVVIWAAFIVSATLTQARFGYYLTVPVAALNAALVGTVMAFVRESGSTDPVDIEAYQVLAVVAVLLVVVAPMVLVGAGPIRTASGAQNPGGIVGWQDSLNWLEEQTPAEGTYGNASEPMPHYGTFARQENFDYPPGSYGVMSWWDYGHWITAKSERIPNANPFQQGARTAAEFLLTRNESESLAFFERIDEPDAQTRYVMIDWKMIETESLPPVRGKFFAPPTWDDGTNRSMFYSRVVDTELLQERNSFPAATTAMLHKQPYYESMVARLYLYHGSAQQPGPVVTDWQGTERRLSTGSTFVEAPREGSTVRIFDNVSAARDYVESDDSSQLGGLGPYPAERVPALKHYRLVYMSEPTGFQGQLGTSFQRTLQLSGLGEQLRQQLPDDVNQTNFRSSAIAYLYPNTPSWTKTFERVDGATIEGSGPANETLEVAVQLRPENGREFTYRQRVRTDDDGEFSTTVPYATTGYDELGPAEGYTNTSVRATGPYSITSPVRTNESEYLVLSRGTVNVTEAQVVGADESPVTVDLQERVVAGPPVQNGTGTNTTANATTGSNVTDVSGSNETQSAGGTDAGTDEASAESLAPVEAVAGRATASGAGR